MEEKTTHPVTTPPRYPSEPEVREKLCQLETEIERFRTLNSKLEQQNKEKEQVCHHHMVCHVCISPPLCDVESEFSKGRDIRVSTADETRDGTV